MQDEPASITHRLRQETWNLHRQSQAGPLTRALLHSDAPQDLYLRLLGQRFIIHRALERHLRALATRDARVAMVMDESLFEAEKIRRDLGYFHASPGYVELADATWRLLDELERLSRTCPLALLGSYYVLEGSKNGIRIIATTLLLAFAIPPGAGLLYSDPYTDPSHTTWQEFKGRLDELHCTDDEVAEIVAAARRAFELLLELDQELFPPAEVSQLRVLARGPEGVANATYAPQSIAS